MLDIMEKMAEKSSFTITTEAKDFAKMYFENKANSQKKNKNEFGNARGIRNFLEKAILKQASRISSIENLDTKTAQILELTDFYQRYTEKILTPNKSSEKDHGNLKLIS